MLDVFNVHEYILPEWRLSNNKLAGSTNSHYLVLNETLSTTHEEPALLTFNA